VLKVQPPSIARRNLESKRLLRDCQSNFETFSFMGSTRTPFSSIQSHKYQYRKRQCGCSGEMAMKCPNCGTENPETARFCQACARTLGPAYIQGLGTPASVPPSVQGRNPRSRRTTWLVASAVAIAIVIVVLLAVVLNPSTSPVASIHDADGDGHADSTDAFPNDPSEWLDTDLDGVGDNSDAFPNDSTQWVDRDHDGHGDNPLGINPDAFPDDLSEWKDTDSDGVGNNADFYDSGNGKIKISVDYYMEDGTADFWTYGDPYFIISVDTNVDNVNDVTQTSDIFTDTQTLTSPYSIVVDVPDNCAAVKFSIQVYDDDLGSYQAIDYCPSPTGAYYIHTVPAPFSGSWSYNGSDDGINEIDCILDYSISVTA